MRPKSPRPALELLEDRIVPAGGVKLSGGTLLITGTAGNDSVLVRQIPGQGNQPAQVAVTFNGQTFTFKVSQVSQVQAQLNGGNDSFVLDHSSLPVTPPVTVDGGNGTDSLAVQGTAGADVFTVTGSTVGLAGTGGITYSNVESLSLDGLG